MNPGARADRTIARRLVLVLPALLMSGCALGGGNRPAPRLYDFGVAPPRTEAQLPAIALGTVRSAPTLAGTEIRYRFASDPYQARAYGESWWLASPSDLLANRLAAALEQSAPSGNGSFGGPPSPAPLRLVVELSTFEQVFDGPGSARAVLELVAEVQDSRTRLTIGRRTVALERATPTADAAGAVTALVELADEAIADVLRWIADEIEPPPAVVEPGDPGEAPASEPPRGSR